MRAIARHLGTEEEFEGLVTSSQSILPPKEASEMEIKRWQVKQDYYCTGGGRASIALFLGVLLTDMEPLKPVGG